MMAKFLSLVFVTVLFFVQTADAAISTASREECEEVLAAGIMKECTPGETIIDDATRAWIGGGAHAFLDKRACRNVTIACLDPEFANRVQKMILAAQEQGLAVPPIISAYRSPEHQARLYMSGITPAPPCGSFHQYGLAVDFNAGLEPPTIRWMHANSRRFGIATIGAHDPGHFQIAGISSRQLPRSKCGVCNSQSGGQVQSCVGGGSGGFPSAGNPMQQAFSQASKPLSDLFRQEEPVAPPATTLPSLGTTSPVYDAFAPTRSTTTASTASPVLLTPQGTSTKKKIPPSTHEEILTQISVGAPPGTTTPTTTPLTQEEYERLYGQQTIVVPPQLPTTVVVTNNQLVVQNTAPYAGFSLTQGEEQTRVFMKMYIDILGKVARALGEVLRIVHGEPQTEIWFGE